MANVNLDIIELEPSFYSKVNQDQVSKAQAYNMNFELHTLGWKAFQDLCAKVCEEVYDSPVEIFREAQDGGQDAVMSSKDDDITIQCKFSSKARQKLKLSDISKEKESIKKLLEKGQAKTYIVMTNLLLDGPIRIEISNWLKDIGVLDPKIYGHEYITQKIIESPTLRAMVPRVYGLGDLSTILDERAAAQTKALLGHMEDSLKVYVPTKPHREAIEILKKHKIVLLLGDPATGKSTIASILATLAAENPEHQCYKADSPDDFLKHWNPNERENFYWIDDAFGSNQLREDFVGNWIQIFPKIHAAIKAGNRFVLTSRKHIYKGAKYKLGTKNLPHFENDSAIVNVGELTIDEKQQILYNHIKAGNQEKFWKFKVKEYLGDLAAEPTFLPEIARRLADPAYTTNISTRKDDLIKFVKENRNYLLKTIEELSQAHQAVLTLIFLHRGQMPLGDQSLSSLVKTKFMVSDKELSSSFEELEGSFIIRKFDNHNSLWAFKHPTIVDALSEILVKKEGLLELYLKGAKTEDILGSVQCDGANSIEDAVLVPENYYNLLIERLLEISDEENLNEELFSFLNGRASDDFFKAILKKDPNILYREVPYRWHKSLSIDNKVRVFARAFSFGILPDVLRYDISDTIESSLTKNLDVSFLEYEEVLDLVQPSKLLFLLFKLKESVVETALKVIAENCEDADLDGDPENNFEEISSKIDEVRGFFEQNDFSEDVEDLFHEIDVALAEAIENVKKRKEEYDRDSDDEDDGWDWHSPTDSRNRDSKHSLIKPDFLSSENKSRSIFSDVDE